MNICIFCSSSNGIEEIYFEQAEQLGRIIGEEKHTLVYGGANVGLMEHIANSVKQSGGRIIGIIPQKIHDFELTSNVPDEVIITATMDERKKLMRDKADAFIALPGGFGTLEEILEVITLKQLDYHRKPIVFLNTNDFFNDLFKQFEKSFSESFAKTSYRELYTITNKPAEVLELINANTSVEIDNKWFKVPQKIKTLK